jgi:hypothetical protein
LDAQRSLARRAAVVLKPGDDFRFLHRLHIRTTADILHGPLGGPIVNLVFSEEAPHFTKMLTIAECAG